ncbi:hypothetical protein [Olivibacter jilunii]|uniref:hypothetical protein n=1 Tax=Olivibacter jilunii TaxID=985016 RepID=UPI001031B2F9|nr:hypothetical protein [Olivibacter jilunii]
MNTEKVLKDFFQSIEKDGRIGVSHIGIFTALVQFWQTHNYDLPIQAFSHQIMPLAKIASTNTYHRCIRDLNAYGYIHYEPSYKRNQGSKVNWIGMESVKKEVGEYVG